MRIGEIVREGEREVPVWEPQTQTPVAPAPEKTLGEPRQAPEKVLA
jgi:hypothetical protein